MLTLGIPEVDPHRHARPAPVTFPPGFLGTMAVVALAGIAFGTVVTFMPTFVHHEADLGSVSVFFLPYTAAAIGTRFIGAGLGDRIGHRRVIVPALGTLGCAIAAIASVHSVVALALVAVVFGVAQGIVYPTLNAFTIEHVASGQLGRVQTLFNGAFNLGVTTGSFALGGVADAYGHRAAFLCAGITALLATALFSVSTGDAGARAMRRSSLDSDASASG